jgi:BlaI family penicillinase repressor
VRSLLARLVKKGAIAPEEDGRSYRYTPLITEAECVREETESFLRRVWGGAVSPMLARLIEDGIDADELDSLEALVAAEREKRRKKKGGSK